VPDGQWYLHTFAKEQPDWNWDNREVQLDFLRTLRFWADRGVDGFRIDVANNLKKDLSANPLPSQGEINDASLWEPGRNPFRDRNEVFDVYREWRQVFDEYDPPRVAVAEAWVEPERQHLYAAPDGLGQVFNFDLLKSNFSAAEFREVIARNIAQAFESGSSNTWVLSNHDVVRHATRYGLPFDATRDNQMAREWDLFDGSTIPLDAEQGLRRARAATLLLLALPGSTYMYQGEELGLPSITGISPDERQDPTFFRNKGHDVGRDGCRIPIPWAAAAPSYGFGPGVASHISQPAAWASFAVDTESADPASTLSLYRNALALRHKLQVAEELEWLDSETPDDSVLLFARPAGPDGRRWVCATNFGSAPGPMPAGELLLASSAITDTNVLPAETTAWLRR
jgi:alpha-glucosidase